MFRIAQEAVNNAIKHAGASRLMLELRSSEQFITMRVCDDGKGLPNASDESSGVGLRIMRHRADLIGAILKVRAADAGGTEISCAVPRSITTNGGDE
jgi:signal transduction histidine kinase